jgi:glycosyltransferase involved in cell wall biosynthesis
MNAAAIFLSHNGMTEALGQTQVLPYLRGLSVSGVRFDLLACEPPGADPAAVARIKDQLRPFGIRYTALRRRPSHSLADKVRDSGRLLAAAVAAAVRGRGVPAVLHARSQLPGAVAEVLAALSRRTRFLFDCRGLLAQEYVDMGHWRPGELRHRLATGVEASLLRRADRVVVLTEALRDRLCDPGGPLADRKDDVHVIPCCVDPDRFRPDPAARARHRRALGLRDDQPLLCFAGSMARYDMVAAAALFAGLRRRCDARFLLLSRADAGPLRAQLLARGAQDALHTVAAPAAEVPGWLAAADLAVAFLRDSPSSIATSPTKIAEGLAAGLPTAVSAGIADCSRIVGPGLLPVPTADAAALDEAAATLLSFLADPERARAQARETALLHFSLPDVGIRRYQALYRELV